MEHTVTRHAVNSVKTRAVSQMIKFVYPALLVITERCVTRSAQDIAYGINANDLLVLQSALLTVRLASMAQVAISSAHSTV